MISPAGLQQAILSLLCYNDEVAPVLARRIELDSFLGRVNQILARTSLEYIQQYGKAPKDQLELLLEADFRRGEDGRLLGQTLDMVKQQAGSIQAEFILTELSNFQESQLILEVSQLVMEEVNRGNLGAAKDLLGKLAFNGTASRNDEIWLSDAAAMLSFLDNQDREFISSGVEAFDQVGACPDRQTLTFMLASSGKGKTWFLINVLKAALQHHHPAVYITLELSAKKAAGRLLQALFSLTRHEVKQLRVPYFERDGKGNVSIGIRELQRDPIIAKRKDLARRIADFTSYPPIVIKEFSTGSLTLRELEDYLLTLEKEKKLIPTVVCLDYTELMRLDGENLRIDIGRTWVGLRGIAVRRNCAMITASQGNRDSDTAKLVDKNHAAEDWSKIGTADLVYTYSQTPQEKQLGLSRLLVAKSRDSEDRVLVLNSQSYPIGQFSLDSTIMTRDVGEEAEKFMTGAA
jgi:hypothetical protein